VSDFGRLRSYDRFFIPVHALVWTASIIWQVAIFSQLQTERSRYLDTWEVAKTCGERRGGLVCPATASVPVTGVQNSSHLGASVTFTMPFIFSFEEYADMIYVYGFCDSNSVLAVAEYQQRFPNRRIPNRRVFTGVYQALRDTGKVCQKRCLMKIRTDRNLQHITVSCLTAYFACLYFEMTSAIPNF